MSKNNEKNITATYRLQLTPDFDFYDCIKVLSYLSELQVTGIYTSSYLKAEKGSTHGYDVVDHQKINDELGGRKGFDKFAEKMKQLSLKHILDIVPNHVSIKSEDNKLWQDVLEKGRDSRFFDFFDINSNPPQKRLQDKILLPVLGGHYSDEIEDSRLTIQLNEGDIKVIYYENCFPLSVKSKKSIIKSGLENFGDTETNNMAERYLKESDIAQVFANKSLRNCIAKEIEKINNDKSMLDEILSRQNYLLSYWRAADTDINYRRFFSINDLAGLKVEKKEVFYHVHKLIFELAYSGDIDGLRIDHIDGLYDPKAYLESLRKRVDSKWIIAEKILSPDEKLPENWPIEGTTGYDFLNKVNGLFIYPENKKQFTDLYQKLTGRTKIYEDVLFDKKLDRLNNSFSGEKKRLLEMLEKTAMDNFKYRDLTLKEISQALETLIASFDVYRTYISTPDFFISDQDRKILEKAITKSKKRRSELSHLIWEIFEDIFFAKIKNDTAGRFIMAFQQLTGPVMAKGAEDTAFYCYNRFISLNEVGGNPSQFGTSLEDFLCYCSKIQEKWPRTMLTTSTHDTKRGEDVRMRINMLSDIPDTWKNTVENWFEMNKKYHKNNWPDSNSECFLYQTLAGCWPVEKQRITDYMIKVAREAKEITAWKDQNQNYENALREFISGILSDDEFTRSLTKLVEKINYPARICSLAKTLIKCTAPGIPDIYQGSELWNMSLVDPDNRRSVDYEKRKKLFSKLNQLSQNEILNEMDSGLPKMYVIHKTLQVRNKFPEIFDEDSDFRSVNISGEKSHHVIAFSRMDKLITLAPRWLIKLKGDWKDTAVTLPEGQWKNIFTDEEIEGKVLISDLFENFPVTLLLEEEYHERI